MPLKYRHRLLDHLSHDSYTPSRIEEIAADLRVDDAKAFRDAVNELARQGELSVSPGGLVQLPSFEDSDGELTGEFRGNPRGFGFVRPDRKFREGDLFIPPDETGQALTGDHVRVEVFRDERRGRGGGAGGEKRYVGVIMEILRRKRTRFSAEVFRRGKQWLGHPDGKELFDAVLLPDAESKNVREGDKVIIELIEHPDRDSLGEAAILKVLGEAGRPDVETEAVIAAHNLPGEFPESCLDQASELTRQFDAELAEFERRGASALELRDDLTGEYIVTIDPPDAKDYDDAISIKALKDGWELGVYIADVGHFIASGTPLDAESRDRGNSVYLPRLVIPMLPETLSNGICSLQERVPRYAKSAVIRYDRDGNVTATGFSSALITSAKRMTYLEAQALIDGNPEEARTHAKTDTPHDEKLIETVREMDRLARTIRDRRRRQGMISLELPDVELIYDEHGHVVDAEPEDDAFTHTLIEMFMVEANESVARLFERLGVPLMRRIHPEPTPGDVDELRQTAMVAGYRIPKHPTREELQALLDSTRGTPAARPVHMAVLRTLTKAQYSPALIGHFALASEAYAHFTSPIRRYADLTVHRALGEYLRRTENGRTPPKGDHAQRAMGEQLLRAGGVPPEQDLVELGRHLGSREENAEGAERELRQFLVLQLMEKKIGESFPGVVTGVTPKGVFIQIDKYLAEGLIKKEDLPGDVTRSNQTPMWRIDPKSGALVDAHSGRSFSLGDSVRVRIANVNLALRQMDLVIEDDASRAEGKRKGVQGLTLGSDGGGLGRSEGAGFKSMTGGQRRSRKSKSRDKGKTDYRRDKKK